MSQKEDVINYYRDSQEWYNFFWGKNGIHFGLWDESTKTHDQSVQNTNEFVALLLGVTETDILLDAGCGIGATAKHIAENYRAHVIGIALAENQVTIAKNSSPPNISNLVRFVKGDFESMDFKNESFDKVYAIESICHGDPIKFIAEAHRVVKKNGKLVVLDYSIDNSMDESDMNIYQTYVNGHHVPGILTVDRFQESLHEAGFTNINYVDLSERAAISFERMHKLQVLAGWFLNPLSDWGILSKEVANTNRGSKAMYELFNNGLITYSAFSAER